jgi:hypothetical protein
VFAGGSQVTPSARQVPLGEQSEVREVGLAADAEPAVGPLWTFHQSTVKMPCPQQGERT